MQTGYGSHFGQSAKLITVTCAPRLVVNSRILRPQHSHGAGPRRIRSFRKNGSFPDSYQLVQVLPFIKARWSANAFRTERLETDRVDMRLCIQIREWLRFQFKQERLDTKVSL